MSFDVNVSKMRELIGYYVRQLLSVIDRRALVRVYQSPRRSDRLYSYSSILQDACCSVFRGGVGMGKRPVVYGFDGRLWVPLLPMVFETAVRDALVEGAGSGSFVVKGDWVDRQSKLLQWAYDGVSASPLLCRSDIVGFRNGVWDFSDIEHPVCHKFSERLPIVSLLDYDYDESAVCPRWLSFLGMMLSPADILVLQKYLGLGCVRRSVMSHRVEDALWLVGGGANGKSTIENIVRAVYGSVNVSNASLSQLLDRQPDARMRAVMSIEGKVFNICDEVDVSDITRGSDGFKKLCSGEPQNVRGIGCDIRVAYDIPFMIFSMNQMPFNRRMDEAFRRRIVRIDFRSQVREEDMDRELLSKLMKELSGIRNWMMDGYRKLVSDNFQFQHSLDDVYMEQNEQYFDIFCKENGLRASGWAGRDEKPQKVLFTVLFDAYNEFCRRRLYDGGSEVKVGRDLSRLGFVRGRSGQGRWYYVYCDVVPRWMS